MNEKIISYDSFLNMRYLDFKRIEAVYLYKNKLIKSKTEKDKKDKTKSKLQGLPSKDFSQYFSKEQIEQLKAN